MDLTAKLKKIEALIAGAQTEGEKQAALFAKKRLKSKMAGKAIEFSIRVDSLWKKKLFMALCHKHGLHPYRYKGQKRTTTMVQVSQALLDEVLWPEFKTYAKLFDELADSILFDLIAQIHDVGDLKERVIAGEIAQSV